MFAVRTDEQSGHVRTHESDETYRTCETDHGSGHKRDQRRAYQYRLPGIHTHGMGTLGAGHHHVDLPAEEEYDYNKPTLPSMPDFK